MGEDGGRGPAWGMRLPKPSLAEPHVLPQASSEQRDAAQPLPTWVIPGEAETAFLQEMATAQQPRPPHGDSVYRIDLVPFHPYRHIPPNSVLLIMLTSPRGEPGLA